MKMKKTVFAAVVAAVAFSSASASASCWISGNPTHIWTYASQNYTTVFTHNGAYFTYFRVSKSDPELLALGGQTPAEAYRAGRPVDMMDKPDGLPTYPPAQQQQQDVINKVLAA